MDTIVTVMLGGRKQRTSIKIQETMKTGKQNPPPLTSLRTGYDVQMETGTKRIKITTGKILFT